MSWPMVKLGDVLSIIRGVTFKPNDQVEPLSEGSTIVMRTKNVQRGGLDISDLIAIPDSFIKRDEQYLRSEDMLISSANSWELVGKISFIDKLPARSTAGGFISIIRAKKEKVIPKYLYYWLTLEHTQVIIRNCGQKTTNISNLNLERFKELFIPLPSLYDQRRIVAILDKAANIRQKREQAIKLADDFLRATFLAMFGDPVENPKRWDVASLLEYGSFKNGMNFTKGESGSVLKCLGVGNFKSLATITCMDNIGEIELNTLPSDDYLLKDGDIVFVRSNGNKALVGRCLTIYPNKEKVTFSGFCIRYRIEKSAITAEYLNFLFRTPSMKRQMLSGGQGANIQNISQGTLSALRIPVPPLDKQLAFARLVDFHASIVKKQYDKMAESENLFDALTDNFFTFNDL
ncbi:restriction endonuclease subunit S [Serratia marcescens]|uniref:restriction endonuclease subunit S n=1 Tax=Serratia marcescens TaxID=615 RepID=UPI0011C02D36|nr:restriction endonuclease subunit S [Serratia marcescens]